MVDTQRLYFANFFAKFSDPATSLLNYELAFDNNDRMVWKDGVGVLHYFASAADYANLYSPNTITITQNVASAKIGVGTEGDYSNKVTNTMPLECKITATGIHKNTALIQYSSTNTIKDILPLPEYFTKLGTPADIFNVQEGKINEQIAVTTVNTQPVRTVLTNNAIFRVMLLDNLTNYDTDLALPKTTESNKDNTSYRNYVYVGSDNYLYIIKDKTVTELTLPIVVFNQRTSPVDIKFPNTYFMMSPGDKFTFKRYRRVTKIIDNTTYQFIGSGENFIITEILRAAKTTALKTEYSSLTISGDGKSVNGIDKGLYYDIIVATNEAIVVPSLQYKMLDITDGFFKYIYSLMKNISSNSSGVSSATINSGTSKQYIFTFTLIGTAASNTQFTISSDIFTPANGDKAFLYWKGLLLDEGVDYSLNTATNVVTLTSPFSIPLADTIDGIIFKSANSEDENIIITSLQNTINTTQADLTLHKLDSNTAHGINTLRTKKRNDNDFLRNLYSPYFVYNAINSGTNTQIDAEVNHDGINAVMSSGTANSGYSYYSGNNSFMLSANDKFIAIFKTPTSFSGNQIRMGFGRFASDRFTLANLSADGGIILADIISGILTAYVGNLGTNTASGNTYTLSTSTWYKLTITVNSTKTAVTFNLYNDANAVLWTSTINSFPINNVLGAFFCAINTGTAITTNSSIDYLAYELNNTNTRNLD